MSAILRRGHRRAQSGLDHPLQVRTCGDGSHRRDKVSAGGSQVRAEILKKKHKET